MNEERVYEILEGHWDNLLKAEDRMTDIEKYSTQEFLATHQAVRVAVHYAMEFSRD